MRKFLTAALLAAPAFVGLSAPAFAQESAPFTGPRVEGIVGWDRAQAEGDHEDGVVYGAVVGYDWQMGGAVVGAELEATDSSADVCARDVSRIGDRLCVGAKRDLYVGARVGTAVTPSTLLYAKAGYTNARFGYDYDDGGNGDLDYGNGTNLDGVRVGAGVEQKLGPNTFVKGEYRYSNYEAGVSKNQVLAGFGVRF
ncbi:outer membrane immunogenic protein [Sphingomonas zeicaulis]|uniref:outer membrane protein n=1 Tax=Sphingomonas zeicaulis TaxID=1632740 RepID=UPI003D1B5D7F